MEGTNGAVVVDVRPAADFAQGHLRGSLNVGLDGRYAEYAGTVVAPDADVRLLLTADPEIRMARRQAELGDKVDATQLADQVLRRDSDDSKLVNFTTAADGVTHLDCTYLTLAETIQAVLDLVASTRG